MSNAFLSDAGPLPACPGAFEDLTKLSIFSQDKGAGHRKPGWPPELMGQVGRHQQPPSAYEVFQHKDGLLLMLELGSY